MTTDGAGSLSDDDVSAIRRTLDAFPKHFVSRDFDVLAAMYATDAVLMPPNHPAVQGRDAIKQFLGGFPRISQMEVGVAEIEGRGDLAYVRGTYTMTLHPDGAPEPVEDAGKYLEIRRKQSDGSWLYVADMFNSDNE